MNTAILKEITPLTINDCFTSFSRKKTAFDFPLHYHEEIELNFITNAKHAQRIVGDHIAEIDAAELVLVGSNLPHVWQTHKCTSKEIKEITIQFHKTLLDDNFLQKNQLSFIRGMLEKSAKGILFSQQTIKQIAPRIIGLQQKQGFDSVLELLSILHELSVSQNMQTLSTNTFNNTALLHKSRRIEKAFQYINQNFDKQITLKEVAKLNNMTPVSFSRFFKAKAGINFIDCVTEIRTGHATRMLIDTAQSVAEIAYHCGFNNISNFNRIFKNKKGCTPKTFRENYTSSGRIFI